jgi:adiponectin receptor
MVRTISQETVTPAVAKDDGKKGSSEHWYSLIHWDDLPHWQQDNHHIHGSYRRASGSYRRSLASLFYIHNETVNIYTHLIPALATIPSAYLLHRTLRPRYAQATTSDILAFSCFFLGAALCLGMSATYHTISNHSPRVNRLGNQLDYVGIVLLISGSFVPSIYYGFWCDSNLQKTYWTMVSLV